MMNRILENKKEFAEELVKFAKDLNNANSTPVELEDCEMHKETPKSILKCFSNKDIDWIIDWLNTVISTLNESYDEQDPDCAAYMHTAESLLQFLKE